MTSLEQNASRLGAARLMEGSWFQTIIVRGNRHVMLILVLIVIYFHSRMMEELRGMEYEERLKAGLHETTALLQRCNTDVFR